MYDKKTRYVFNAIEACCAMNKKVLDIEKRSGELSLGFIGDYRRLTDEYFKTVNTIMEYNKNAKFYFFTISDYKMDDFLHNNRVIFVDSMNIDEYLKLVDISIDCGSIFEEKLNQSDKVYLSYLQASIQVNNHYSFTLEHWSNSLENSDIFLSGTLETFQAYGYTDDKITSLVEKLNQLDTVKEKANYLIDCFWNEALPSFFISSGVSKDDVEDLIDIFFNKTGIDYYLKFMEIVINQNKLLEFFKLYSSVRHNKNKTASAGIASSKINFLDCLNFHNRERI